MKFPAIAFQRHVLDPQRAGETKENHRLGDPRRFLPGALLARRLLPPRGRDVQEPEPRDVRGEGRTLDGEFGRGGDALGLLGANKSKGSIKTRRKSASCNTQFLLAILQTR